jgi:hypothetical protein
VVADDGRGLLEEVVAREEEALVFIDGNRLFFSQIALFA